MDKFWEVVGKFIGWIVMNVIGSIINGYTVTILWGWIVVQFV